jgi:hypothetical protein
MAMSLVDAVVALVVLVGLGLIGSTYAAANAVDLGAAFRNAGLARPARKLARAGSYPNVVERTYWSSRDYVRESQRLKAPGYSVRTESMTGPYLVHHVPGGAKGGANARSVAVNGGRVRTMLKYKEGFRIGVGSGPQYQLILGLISL